MGPGGGLGDSGLDVPMQADAGGKGGACADWLSLQSTDMVIIHM